MKKKMLIDLGPEEVKNLREYQPKNKIRFITATALFDGHDASINIMRRLLQARGAEVIHLGHNRTAQEICDAAIQEDAHGIAVSSYQGGHMEFFPYLRELLNSYGGHDKKIYGGGGGVISLEEIALLEKKGVEKIYSPEDGQKLGLDGIIGHILYSCDFSFSDMGKCSVHDTSRLARELTLLENNLLPALNKKTSSGSIILGVTGTGGAGKSSLVDELLLRFLHDFPDIKIGLLCIDPSKKRTGGALLGDRIRVNACSDSRIFLRSMATRGSGRELSHICAQAVDLMKKEDFHFIIVETSGIGQGDTGILDVSDVSLYVMTPEYGASTQLEKIDMIDFANFICVNKFERAKGPDAVKDIQTTLRRSRYKGQAQKPETYNVFGTIASRYNDDGVNGLYRAIVQKFSSIKDYFARSLDINRHYAFESSKRYALISPERESYLHHISQTVRKYHENCQKIVDQVYKLESLEQAVVIFQEDNHLGEILGAKAHQIKTNLPETLLNELESWPETQKRYKNPEFYFTVRGKKIAVESCYNTLSLQNLPRISAPDFKSKADLTRFLLKENLPGYFPYTGGIFPFRRRGEDPKRQFAGEGGPKRTNARFHYLSKNDSAKRLSTAFDSITLYGSSPDKRPDIYGKIGESGVSIAHLDDMKLLYSGFDLCDQKTSVSMTINGPAPIILAMFLNTAIDQEVDKFLKEKGRNPNSAEYAEIHACTLSQVRGTVQADILKEDQAQNTCIFSTEFALKMMGDIQEYLIEKKMKNYYSVSISGYHIAEAGANPITQLAFTLANGFTYVEYYLAKGMNINDFADNLSFFFSNGIDTEYAVLGRVARRIWAIALRDYYGASEKAQKLKYHIQTSGRSLHAQEIDFNDIRTTLQALMALYDNCNSLHTNAYDEALTTPTEQSVRRAMAIQMIINHEFGPNKCENVNQGSFFIEQLTDLVEEAVLSEFERISIRGGVLGAMENQYQRNKIQEESLYYEQLKDSGALPIMGVNTFLSQNHDTGLIRQTTDLIRASYEEKDDQLKRLFAFQERNKSHKEKALSRLTETILAEKNIFSELMETVKYCSLGEITDALYRNGGKYRRAM